MPSFEMFRLEKPTFIDTSAHLSGKEWAFDDHVHVMTKGSDALAQFVADKLQLILRK